MIDFTEEVAPSATVFVDATAYTPAYDCGQLLLRIVADGLDCIINEFGSTIAILIDGGGGDIDFSGDLSLPAIAHFVRSGDDILLSTAAPDVNDAEYDCAHLGSSILQEDSTAIFTEADISLLEEDAI